MRVLTIPGSLRRDSHNAALLRHLAEQAPAGIDVEVWDGLREIPLYDADIDVDDGPIAVRRMRAAVQAAEAIVIATPEYNSSIPGGLKNALDWLSRPKGEGALQGKPVGVTGASTGRFGGVWAQAELRKVLAASGARVVAPVLAVGHAQDAFDASGGLIEAEQTSLGLEILDALATEVTIDRQYATQAIAA